MNKVFLTLVFVITFTTINAQNDNKSLNYLASNDSFVYTETSFTPNSDFLDNNKNDRKHNAFRGMRRSGIILTSIGGAFLLAGTAGVIYGNTLEKDSLDSDFTQFIGATAIIGGGAGTLAGLTLWIIGNNKMKKYPLSNDKISFNVGANTMKLTYRF